MHKHHIMPRCLGGTNDLDNLVEVSVEEHAKIHHSLWILGGRWQDEMAWRCLSGQVTGRPLWNRGKKGLQTAWNKGLTKTDPRVASYGRAGSKTNKGRLAWNKGKKGLQTAWNKGLTKETDERVAAFGMAISKSTKGKIAWNKGLTKETNY